MHTLIKSQMCVLLKSSSLVLLGNKPYILRTTIMEALLDVIVSFHVLYGLFDRHMDIF